MTVFSLLVLGLRFASSAAAIVLFVVAAFLYETEEGRLQSTIEDWWVRISDLQSVAISRHAVFMRGVAQLLAKAFDSVFGIKLWSMRAVIASACFTASSIGFGFMVLLAAFFWSNPDNTNPWTWRLITIPLEFVYFLVLAITPARLKNQRQMLCWEIAASVSLFAMFLIEHDWLFGWNLGFMSDKRVGLLYQMSAFAIVMIVGVASDFAFIAVTRWLVQWSGEQNSSLRIALASTANLGLAMLFIVVPYSRSDLLFESTLSEHAAELIMTANALDVIVGGAYIILSLFLLVHRIIWPVITRALYALARFRLAERRAVLAGIGLALLGAGLPGVAPFISSAIDFLKKR